MYDETKREFISDSESWDVFVGGISPEQFVMGYDTIEAAVDAHLFWLEEEERTTPPD